MFTTSQILEAKAPSIYAFLLQKGFAPDIDKAYYALFKSPFRSERTASFKVDKNENLFYDHGTGEGGDFIKLFQNFTGMNFKEAMQSILANSFSFQCEPSTTTEKPAPEMTLHRVKDLQNRALLDYLKSRRIDVDIAQFYCKEVYYYVGTKHYFAIGFRNESEGFELRNMYFKGCIGTKDITYCNSFNFERICLFEGFFDFLACLSLYAMRGKSFDADCIILNSVTQLKKALPYLEGYDKIFTFFDNDRAGEEALRTLQASYTVQDCSKIYKPYKDFAEFWEKDDEAY